MLVTIDELKHVLFPPLSRLVHINGNQYSTFIMQDIVAVYEKEKKFNLEDFIKNLVADEKDIEGFYLIDHYQNICHYILTKGGWDIDVEEYLFRAGVITFVPDKFTFIN